jgi:hypothetical protein
MKVAGFLRSQDLLADTYVNMAVHRLWLIGSATMLDCKDEETEPFQAEPCQALDYLLFSLQKFAHRQSDLARWQRR